jgi:hypothetical protein
MQNNTQKSDYLYSQGIANLRLEGMSLSQDQDRIVKRYQSGKITKEALVKEAVAYARSR